jgi:hypothetical protein
MKRALERIALGIVTAFVALTALWGGIALLLGTYQHGVLMEAGTGARFPVDWLRGTPFGVYTVPALILAISVGGSALAATALIFTGRKTDLPLSLAAGIYSGGLRRH